MIPIKHATCPTCGGTLIRDDEAHMLLHSLPECEWFQRVMAKFGASSESVELRDPETGQRIGTTGQA